MVENTNKWVIFDLDGTLADIEIRRKMAINSKGKMDWDIFFAPALVAEDDPNIPVIMMARLQQKQDTKLLYFQVEVKELETLQSHG